MTSISTSRYTSRIRAELRQNTSRSSPSSAGGIAYSDGDGSLNVKQKPSGPADSALKYGREVISYETRSAAALSPQRFAMGFGPAGSGGADDALRPSVDAIPGSAADGGAGVWRMPTPLLRVPSAATTASGALQCIAAAQAERVTADCFLLPALRPGSVIEVQDLPDGLSTGPWLITRVQHSFERGFGTTRFWGETATAGSSLSGGLLGAAAGAIGGLL